MVNIKQHPEGPFSLYEKRNCDVCKNIDFYYYDQNSDTYYCRLCWSMYNTKFFTGIGSRNVPDEIGLLMTRISTILTTNGYWLRSGGAGGSDESFEKGVMKHRKCIFLPWKNFNNNKSNLYNISENAYNLAEKFHPLYNNLSYGSKKLITRDVYQILGYYLNKPSEFVVCWTPKGKLIGGTSQALRIAEHYNIKIYNLFFYDNITKLFKIIDKIKNKNELQRINKEI